MRRHTFAPSSRTLRAFPKPMRRKRQVADSAAEKALPGGRSRTGRPSDLSRDRLSPNRSKGTSRAVDAGSERTGRVGGLPPPIFAPGYSPRERERGSDPLDSYGGL